jgi:hypothetical protein
MIQVQRGGRSVPGFSLGTPREPGGATCLPSGDAALRLMRGQPGALVEVAGTMVARSALMATGLAVAGFRGRELLKGTVAAGLAVEAFVLAWAWKNKD